MIALSLCLLFIYLFSSDQVLLCSLDSPVLAFHMLPCQAFGISELTSKLQNVVKILCVKSGVVVHSCNSSIWEVEVGSSRSLRLDWAT
jgi:hypothetical protein